jgi:repressor LexA
VSRRLTSRNLRVLSALADIERETGGFPPTVREIGSRVELQSTATVQYHIDKLVEFGLVARRGARRVITPQGRALV